MKNKSPNLHKYGQYKNDIFEKLGFDFQSGKKLLDVGCGNGTDAEIFIQEFGLYTYGIDVYKHENVKNIKNFHFKKAGIHNIPYPDKTFDYVFMHDVLHHIDEANQDYENHMAGLKELLRVTKKGGYIIIVEGNRYNPLFYPHMVKMLGHNHFRQSYFKKIILDTAPKAQFKFFESHFYPQSQLWFWKIYEAIMEKFMPTMFIAYNVAIIHL